MCIDYVSIINNCFTGCTFRHLDQIIINNSIKLRRVFTLKNPLMCDESSYEYSNTFMLNHKDQLIVKDVEVLDQFVCYNT